MFEWIKSKWLDWRRRTVTTADGVPLKVGQTVYLDAHMAGIVSGEVTEIDPDDAITTRFAPGSEWDVAASELFSTFKAVTAAMSPRGPVVSIANAVSREGSIVATNLSPDGRCVIGDVKAYGDITVINGPEQVK